MWIPILLICSLPVSGALRAEKYVRGVVGGAITIDCHYEEKYRSQTKYWCDGGIEQCSILVETNGQHGRLGRMSITDNLKQRIFTVTMEDLHSRDTGWYSCGIITRGRHLRFSVHLEVSDESRYVSKTTVSESMWTSASETPVTNSMRTSHSETLVLDSTRRSRSETSVTKSMRTSHSETPVMDSKRTSPSETSVTDSMRTSHSETSEIRFNYTLRKSIQSISDKSYMIWKVGRWVLFALLGIWTITVTWFTRDKKRSDQSDPHRLVYEKKRRIPD
ncbi:uncharacterized protein [Hemitrygon akajei]|uniref:uncharacterized protein n=1 Tax=Hemitrygon akajei TaxID=2704970 RepID=UPI003BF9FD85